MVILNFISKHLGTTVGVHSFFLAGIFQTDRVLRYCNSLNFRTSKFRQIRILTDEVQGGPRKIPDLKL